MGYFIVSSCLIFPAPSGSKENHRKYTHCISGGFYTEMEGFEQIPIFTDQGKKEVSEHSDMQGTHEGTQNME